MPADFGQIANYHRRAAAQQLALAQAARDRHSSAEASYHEQLALRYTAAALEQENGSLTPLGHVAEPQPPRRWPPEARPLPFPLACLLAVQRGAERIGAAIRQSTRRQPPTSLGLSSH